MGDPVETLRVRLLAALDAGIDGITLSAGLHTNSLKLIESHPRFRQAKIGIIVSSQRALAIFLRSANRVNRLPDYIVVEGPLAGGHLGFGADWQNFTLSAIVQEISKYLAAEGLRILIIVAGGIFTGSDAVEMIQLGASGVQVATRFTIARECGLPEKAKQAYLQAEENDVVVNSVSPTGYLMRMLNSSPCLNSKVKPNCEAFGYMLSREGKCEYIEAYQRAHAEGGDAFERVKDKICLCYHFSKSSCYTCGHYVYRLKDTTTRLDDGSYLLPPAEHIFNDYLFSKEQQIERFA